MRTIGLLGGMSWVSTTHYYELINREVAQRLGGDHCAPLVLWQTDFAEITALQQVGAWEEAGAKLAEGAAALVRAGADVVGIGANTMHLVADQVEAALGAAELVHIVDAVRDACVASDIRTIGLLGTAYTMESPELYPPRLGSAGIEVLVPGAAARAEVQRITFEELIHDRATDGARTTFHEVARELCSRGAEGIVLACTEHGLLLADGDLDGPGSGTDPDARIPILDSTVVHARALVAAAMAEA